MGQPSISERKHYRLVPGEASEPTSVSWFSRHFLSKFIIVLEHLKTHQFPDDISIQTLVLTSKDSYYVDVRLYHAALEVGEQTGRLEDVQWAFAGKSHVTNEKKNESGDIVSWHSIWHHYIDTKSDEPESDEGDMTLQDDGSVLEEGFNITETGAKQYYEELWVDLPVEPLGTKGNRHSYVVRADDENKNCIGLVVKIGTYCQGILKTTGSFTIERWERIVPPDGEDVWVPSATNPHVLEKKSNWVQKYRLGDASLPCKMICNRTDGKMGSKFSLDQGDGINWRLVEEYYY